jgi:hypothetical protein
MSQLPPPGDPIGYYATPPSRRPTSVTVFAVLAIVFGSIGTLALLVSIPAQLGMRIVSNPALDAIQRDPILDAVGLASTAIGLGLFITLLCSGVGALSLKPAARKAMILYAWIDIITSILQLILNVAFLHQRTEVMTRKVLSATLGFNPANVEPMIKAGYYGGIALAIVILIWPILILYYMNRLHVKAAFSGNGPPPPVGYYP